MIKHLFKNNWKLQNIVIEEVDNNINEIITDLVLAVICSSRRYEIYYDICSKFNELMKLRKWTKDPDLVYNLVSYKFNKRDEHDYSKYFEDVSAKYGNCSVSDISEDDRKVIFSRVIDIYKSIVSSHSKELYNSRIHYIYPDSITESLEKLFENIP